MKKNSQTKNLIKVLLLFLTSVMLNSSCKKENDESRNITDADRIENAKNWYIKEQQNRKTNIVNSKGVSIALIFKPDWEHAVVEDIAGNMVIFADVTTNLEKVPEMDGNYKLIISLGNKDYSAKITSLNNFNKVANNFSNSELYVSAFNKANIGANKKVDAILKIFNEDFKMDKHLLYTIDNGLRVVDIVKDDPSPDNSLDGKKTSVISYTICTHYYLVVDTYDSSNNLINTETTYLGVSCLEFTTEQIDFIAPDPYSGGNESETLEGGPRSDELSLGSVEEYTDTEGAPRRQWTVSWSFAAHTWRNFHLFGVSTEQCNLKYVTGNWEWVSVINQTYHTGGTIPSGWSYVKDGYSVNYYATKASVQFTSHLAYIMRGYNKTTTPSSTYYDANKR